jgi:Phage derived protein Gp49-like (DUF891)
MREFIFYTDARGRQPVADFFEQELTEREAAYLLAWLEEAAQWPVLQYPQFKRLPDYEPWLGELRANRFRIFVHRLPGNLFLLVHAFKKKSDNTPKAEIKKALARIKDHLNANS